MTFLYAGNNKTETDDWIACIADGVRAADDDSRCMIYVDWDLAETGSTKTMTHPVPYTAIQHAKATMPRKLKVHAGNFGK